MSRPPRRIAAGVYQVGTGGANVFLIDLSEDGRPAAKASADDGAAPGGLVLIDAGIDSEATAIGRAIRDLGRTPADLRAVVVTHFHGDHVGGLAKVRTHTNAETWMHPVDAALVRDGTSIRPLAEGPGRVRSVLARMINRRPAKPREPITVEREIGDGETLPFAGLLAVHTPGHSAGHLALLLPRDGGVLFVGDAATNFARLSHGPIHEDLAESERSLRKLAALDFQVAAFAHGRPIRGGAAERFRRRWPA
jgi:glyoxylase-like metal-dependent hydrolase (beta-lactamase superfamily II)